jgi:hypothetical protein
MLDPTQELLKSTPTKWKIAIAVVISLFLGAIGSGIWDLLFAPGLSMAGGFISRFWSRADDSIFTLAASDPRALPGLVMLLGFAATPLMLAVLYAADILTDKPFLPKSSDAVGLQRELTRLRSKRQYLRWGILIVTLITWFGLRTITNIMADATFAWHAFHQNLAICAPFLTDDQEEQHIASFSRMKNRADFLGVRRELDAVAKARGVQLEWGED